ncbi:MAG: hypothetical protein JWN76_585 [Chitinophagaceae bacterium]|nr:hypothetical protein [Chitinophagaceae bacterium]
MWRIAALPMCHRVLPHVEDVRKGSLGHAALNPSLFDMVANRAELCWNGVFMLYRRLSGVCGKRQRIDLHADFLTPVRKITQGFTVTNVNVTADNEWLVYKISYEYKDSKYTKEVPASIE